MKALAILLVLGMVLAATAMPPLRPAPTAQFKVVDVRPAFTPT
jgi:hypothetical protein